MDPSSPLPVKIGLIGGTGLGALLAGDHSGADAKTHYLTTPFGKPSGPILETTIGGVAVFTIARHGPGHLLSPSHVPYRANLFALKTLGCTHVLASGAVGSLREEYTPRDLVIPEQVIDKTFRRPGTFFEHAAVHVDLREPFCPVLRQVLKDAAAALPRGEAIIHHGGCYVAMEGPAFSTRSESLMHRLWGGDLIGMTAMPEARLAREAELPYALVALVTDYDAWRMPPPAKPQAAGAAGAAGAAEETKPDLMHEILANIHSASEHAMRLIRATIERIAREPAIVANCPAGDALERAILSDKSRIDRDEIERLRPIWGRYF